MNLSEGCEALPCPDDPDAWIDLGHRLKADGRLDDSIRAYSLAIRLCESRADAWRYLGNAYYNQQKYHNALDAYLACAKADPGEIKVWMNLGNTYERLGNVPASIHAFREAARIDPTLSSARQHLERVSTQFLSSESPTSSLD